MELLQLRYFRAVARGEHLTRAAAELHVAQPSLSRAIARLEAELGVPLFERTGRRLRLNRYGAVFLTRAERALAELDDAKVELADAAGDERGVVAVAAETLRALTGLVASFRAAAPGVQLRLYQADAGEMVARLRSGEADLAFASQPLDGAGLNSVVLASEEVLLAVPPDHPLARRRPRRAAVAELGGEPFVVTRPGQWQRTLADQLFSEIGTVPTVACEGNEPAAIRGLVSAGVGIGLLPSISRRTTKSPPVAWLHLDTDAAWRTLRLYWRTDAYLSGAARRFTEHALENLKPRAQGQRERPTAGRAVNLE